MSLGMDAEMTCPYKSWTVPPRGTSYLVGRCHVLGSTSVGGNDRRRQPETVWLELPFISRANGPSWALPRVCGEVERIVPRR